MPNGNVLNWLMFPIEEAPVFPELFYWFGAFFLLINKKLSVLSYVLAKKIVILLRSVRLFLLRIKL